MNRKQRWNVIFDERLCVRCLGSHIIQRCRSKIECGKDGYQRNHHSSLHEDTVKVDNIKNKRFKGSEVQNNIHAHTSPAVFFRILPVTLSNKTFSIITFAFLDEGSSLSLLEERIAQELHLDGPSDDLCLRWTGDFIRLSN